MRTLVDGALFRQHTEKAFCLRQHENDLGTWPRCSPKVEAPKWEESSYSKALCWQRREKTVAGYKSLSCYGETWFFWFHPPIFQTICHSVTCFQIQFCTLEFEDVFVPLANAIVLCLNPKIDLAYLIWTLISVLSGSPIAKALPNGICSGSGRSDRIHESYMPRMSWGSKWGPASFAYLYCHGMARGRYLEFFRASRGVWLPSGLQNCTDSWALEGILSEKAFLGSCWNGNL